VSAPRAFDWFRARQSTEEDHEVCLRIFHSPVYPPIVLRSPSYTLFRVHQSPRRGLAVIERVVLRLMRLCASHQFPVSASNRHRRNYVFALRSALGFSTKNPKRGITSGHRPMLRFGNNKWDWLSLHPTLWRFTVAIPCELPHSADSSQSCKPLFQFPLTGGLSIGGATLLQLAKIKVSILLHVSIGRRFIGRHERTAHTGTVESHRRQYAASSILYRATRNSGTPIAEVYSSGDANARLIAAAPDLLAALRWLLDIAERAQRNAPECETLEAGYA
jgi:hypothetical protein